MENNSFDIFFYDIQDRKSNLEDENEELLLEICEVLSSTTYNNAQEVYYAISNKLSSFDNVYYSVISKFIYEIYARDKADNEEKIEQLIYNLRMLVSDLSVVENEDNKRVIRKLYDHSSLAILQYNNFFKIDDRVENAIERKANAINKDINSKTQNIEMKLVSILGIFTAMAFIVFGGINTLDNIFSGAKDISLIKICIIGSIWAICMFNLIVLFMFFIDRMIKRSVYYDDECGMQLFQTAGVKQIIVLTNGILLCILIILFMIYYLQYIGLSERINDVIAEANVGTVVKAIITLIGLVIFDLVCYALSIGGPIRRFLCLTNNLKINYVIKWGIIICNIIGFGCLIFYIFRILLQ